MREGRVTWGFMGFGKECGLSSERNGKLLGFCAADRHGFKSSFWREKKDLPAVVWRAVCSDGPGNGSR